MERRSDQPVTLITRSVIHDATGRLLLLRRAEGSGRFAGYWEFPGGKADTEDSDVYSTKARETSEETGLVIETASRLVLLGDRRVRDGDFIHREMVFAGLARCVSGELELSSEHSEAEWVEGDAIDLDHVTPDTRELLGIFGVRDAEVVIIPILEEAV